MLSQCCYQNVPHTSSRSPCTYTRHNISSLSGGSDQCLLVEAFLGQHFRCNEAYKTFDAAARILQTRLLPPIVLHYHSRSNSNYTRDHKASLTRIRPHEAHSTIEYSSLIIDDTMSYSDQQWETIQRLHVQILPSLTSPTQYGDIDHADEPCRPILGNLPVREAPVCRKGLSDTAIVRD